MAGTLDIIASVVAGAIALTAVGIAARALWGDRARGRRRCPKCWYDMSAAKPAAETTTDTPPPTDEPPPPAARLTCPECGRASLPRELTRTRRRWGRAAAALLVMLPLAHVTSVQSHIRAEGWTGLVPNWALIAGVVLLPGEGKDVFERAGATMAAAPQPSAVTWVQQTWSARARANRRWEWETAAYWRLLDACVLGFPEGDPRVSSWDWLRYDFLPHGSEVKFFAVAPAAAVTEPAILEAGPSDQGWPRALVSLSPLGGRRWILHIYAGGPIGRAPRTRIDGAESVVIEAHTMTQQGPDGFVATSQTILLEAPRALTDVTISIADARPPTTDGPSAPLLAARFRLPDMDAPAPGRLKALRLEDLADQLSSTLVLDPHAGAGSIALKPESVARLDGAPLVLRGVILRDGQPIENCVLTLRREPGTDHGFLLDRAPYDIAQPPADAAGPWTLRLTGDERLTSVFPEATSYWAGTIEIPVTVKAPSPSPGGGR